MKGLRAFLWAAGLLLLAPGVFVRADETPPLPDSYAEVLLRVEGMT